MAIFWVGTCRSLGKNHTVNFLERTLAPGGIMKCVNVSACFFILALQISCVAGQNDAFIQTDTELRYLVDGISVHMRSGAFPEESVSFGFADLEEESYQIFPSPVKFHPPSVDFGKVALGVPKIQRIILENLSEDTNIQMLSISSNTVHFHCSFFEDKFVTAHGNTSFDVVFLGRSEGLVENSLFVHTSVGSFKYQIKAMSVPNPYGLKPLVGVRMPLNSSYSPTIELHNPYNETLQITEMYSSGGDLHLELPTGLTEGPQAVWEIPPHETKRVMKANFVARVENNHTAYIRIKMNSSEKLDLIVPVEVEVSSQPGLYSPQEVLDFGTLRADQDVVTQQLYLLVSSHKPISIQNVLVTPVNEAVNITFEPKRVSPDTLQGTVVAEVMFDPSKVSTDKQLSGKIVVKSKNNQFKVTVPYRAKLLPGKLRFNSNALYFLADGGRSNNTNHTRTFEVTNEFNVPLLIRNITADLNLLFHFEVESFLPLVLAPNETGAIFKLSMRNRTADLQLSGHLFLKTNASEFRFEVLCYNGQLVPFLGAGIGENYEEGFDFGTMGVGEKRDMRFALRNDNPIEIRIRGWGSNMSRSYVELLGSQRVSALNLFQLQDLPLLPKTLVIKPHHFILFRVGILSAPEQEGMYNAHVFIVTSYQDLFVPFRLRTAKGTMSVPGGGNLIQLGNSFPGKITEKTVRIHSTFRHDLVVDDFTSLPSDARFTFHPTDSGSAKLTPVLQAGEISLIGRLTYDPVIGCSPSCYSSLHLQSKLGQDWLSSLVHPPSLTDLDVFLFSSMRERFERDTSVSRQLNFTFQLDTNEVKGFLFRAQTRLAWPEVVAKKEHTFPMTQIGNSTFTDVTLTNPSSYPLVVQAFLLPTKDSSYTSLKKMLHHLRNWFSAVDDFGTSAASVLMHDDHDEEGVSNSEDSDPTSRHAGESFSFIDLDSDTTLHDSAHGPSASQPVQRIHNLPNLNGTLSVVLAPGANLSLRISFTPDCEMRHESLLVVRNNLTVLDLMFLKGTGGQGHLRFGNRRAGSPMPLLFDIAVKHLKDCDKDKAHASGPPNLTVKRSFTARNTGSLPIHVYGFTIDGFECEGYGFRVMNCRPGFVLPPNGTHKVDIAFTPDFTLTRVQRSLFMSTSLPAGVLNFSLVATLPPQSLAPCWAALPRPAWEAMLGYVAIVAMTVVLLCVLPAAFFEADRILVMAFDFGDDLAFLMPVDAAKAGKASAPSEDAQKKMVAKPLNLKEVGRQAVEELAENSVRRRTNVLNRPSTQKVKDGEMIGEKRESQSLLRLALRFVMYFWNDSSPAWESVKEADKTPETPPATASHQKDAAGSRSNGNVVKQQSQPSSNNKRKTGEKIPAVVPVCTEVTRHSVAVETDRTLEIPVKSQGKKSKRKGRNGAEQRKKDCTKLDEDSSSTTTDNNSLLDDDCDRDLGLKNDAMTKGKKDKRIHHVASEPVISAVPATRSEGKPKQKVEPYKFEVPSNYEAEPVFQPAKKSDPKAKENEAPYFMFNQQANSKTKKSNPVKAAVEKSKSFNGTTNKPLSMQSEESPSPVSAWVLPMESDVGAIKKSKSGSSSSTSSDGFAEMARQTEKFTQEHMPYRLKEKNTNVFSSNSRGLSQGFGMPDSGLRQKAKVIPFQKNMQTQKLCGNPVEPMRQSNPFQQSRARPDLAACSRQRQAFDQELGSFTVLTRPSETTPEQLQALDMLFGARRSKLRPDANDDDDVFRGFGTGLVGDDKTIKTSQQYADAMFAAPPPPPPQPPAAAASSSRMMDIFRMESSCRDTPWPVSRGFFPNDSATTSAFPFGPSRVWDNADPRGEVRDSLWDPPYCRGGSVSPFQSSSVWGNSGLGLGGSSCWSPNVLSGCSSSSFEFREFPGAMSTPPPNPVGTRPMGDNSTPAFGNTSAGSCNNEGNVNYVGFNPLNSGPSLWQPTRQGNNEQSD